jgi:glycosyltransferase involved in cell wall biosynthesis
VVEALAAGRVCLLSPAVFLAAEVEREGAPILCDQDADSYARAMLELLGAPERRRRFATAAREFAKQYDWDAVSAEWEAMYPRAIARSPG